MIRPLISRLACSFALVAVCLAAGCTGPATQYPVKGKVTTKDKEVIGGVSIAFRPINSKGELGQDRYEKTVNDDGTFTLSCPAGRYKVILAHLPGDTTPMSRGGKVSPKVAPERFKLIPDQYTKAEDSPWEVEIPKGGKEDVGFELE